MSLADTKHWLVSLKNNTNVIIIRMIQLKEHSWLITLDLVYIIIKLFKLA